MGQLFRDHQRSHSPHHHNFAPSSSVDYIAACRAKIRDDNSRTKSISAPHPLVMSQLEHFAVKAGIEFPETPIAEKYI
jgi:hypothetical protein